MWVFRVIGDCPGCGKESCYGNVDVCGTHVLRGCKYCRYSVRLDLPPVRKSVLYLDQFFFSKAFRGQDKRFLEAAKQIEQVSSLQLLVAPYSSVHEEETHQWVHHKDLHDFIKKTSRGHEFEAAYNVERAQLLKGFKSWLEGQSPQYTLEQRDALSNDIHKWDGYLFVDVGHYVGEIEHIRLLKTQAIEGLVNLFPEWRTSTNTFEEDVALEIAAAGRGYMEYYLEYLRRIKQGDYYALLDSPIISTFVQDMMHCLPREIPPEDWWQRCSQFFASDHFANLPYQMINSKTYATLKALVKRGAYTNKEKALSRLSGFYYDVKHIATYAPYCQAFVMDQAMAELISHPKIALEQTFGVKVFSPSNWDELFSWLDALEAAMTSEHKQALALAYP